MIYAIGAVIAIGALIGAVKVGEEIFGDATAACARWNAAVGITGFLVALAVASTTSDFMIRGTAAFLCLNMAGLILSTSLPRWPSARDWLRKLLPSGGQAGTVRVLDPKGRGTLEIRGTTSRASGS
jgi:hypothetical protein